MEKLWGYLLDFLPKHRNNSGSYQHFVFQSLSCTPVASVDRVNCEKDDEFYNRYQYAYIFIHKYEKFLEGKK